MPSLIDIRRRIRSVRNTQQITKAMKMVAAARLRRAQDKVIAARPYAGMLAQMLTNVAAAAASDERVAAHPLLAQRPEHRVQLILVTADRGLAGAFNTNLIKEAQRFVEERAGNRVEFETVGRKGYDFFRKRNTVISGEHIGISEKANYADASAIAKKVMGRFAAEEIDAVYVLYNEFKSVISQKLTVRRVLPVAMPETRPAGEYLFEQEPLALLESLLPKYVEIEVYRALLESAAAQHAARMTAMEAATANAGDMIDRLTLYMNRVRQASITKEIIEVVSGAAALE
ncbi:MAG TPA: ATP synthase F1 subunit gamma [Solibacterales bacterium]|nr:ATP synthase F1 subunit gamma [Bryobacterales bacterium]